MRVLLVQLPIPAPGVQPIHGNVPLAAGYLVLAARRHGLEERLEFEILPPHEVDELGDPGLVEAILARRPKIVGFTCYLWNVQRTLWLAEQLKKADPKIVILLGGPEIAVDNGWVLANPAVDYAVVGEGEHATAELLDMIATWAERRPRRLPTAPCIPGVWSRRAADLFTAREEDGDLDAVFSPYLEGILDIGGPDTGTGSRLAAARREAGAAGPVPVPVSGHPSDERLMMLETVRGCAHRCKYCYYPKAYHGVYTLAPEHVRAALRFAAHRGANEVVFLDPTLNQRPDFHGFLRLVAEENAGRHFTCFGEVRAETITAETARLLAAANFTELEIGLQSVDAEAQRLIDRRVDLAAMERGIRALRDEGIRVRIDLILGLPGDTVESVRRGFDYLKASQMHDAVQVFHLSVLPGTALRSEAASLGLRYQQQPPYYVLGTPTLPLDDLYGLMEEAQAAFALEFDPSPSPLAASSCASPAATPNELDTSPARTGFVNLDTGEVRLPPPRQRARAFTLVLRSADFDARRATAAEAILHTVAASPHGTLEILLEPAGDPAHLTERFLEQCRRACYETRSYLDMFYSLQPNRLLGAKRLVAILPGDRRAALGHAWIDAIGRHAAILWRGGTIDPADLAAHEHLALSNP